MDNDALVIDMWKALADIQDQGRQLAVSAELHPPDSAEKKAMRFLSHIAELQVVLENWVKSQNMVTNKAIDQVHSSTD